MTRPTVVRRVASLGDSTSCGLGVGLRVPPADTWPARLADAARAELVPLAVAGARLRDVRRDQLDRAVDSGADLHTLLIGLNDVARAGFDPGQFADELVETVAALHATGARVLVARLPDATARLPLPGRLREAVRTRTAAVDAAVDACARDRVVVLDLGALPGLRARQAWDVDRVHPNAAGHALIAVAAAARLRRVGCRVAPVRRTPLPPAPGLRREAQWQLRHGLPWLAGHLPQVVLPWVPVAPRS